MCCCCWISLTVIQWSLCAFHLVRLNGFSCCRCFSHTEHIKCVCLSFLSSPSLIPPYSHSFDLNTHNQFIPCTNVLTDDDMTDAMHKNEYKSACSTD